MADRTVRAIFDAVVAKAKKNMQSFAGDVADTGKKVDGLTKDLKTLDGTKVKPDIDVEIDKAKKGLNDLTRELADLKSQPATIETEFKIEQTKAAIKDVRTLIKDLTATKAEVRIDASIKDAKKRISEVTSELGLLRTMEVTPQVDADIKAAQKKLRDTKSELRELNGAKAELKVTADTSSAKSALSDMKDDAGQAGAEAGDEAGSNLAENIVDSLKSIPIAGAVVGVGAAIGFALFKGLQDGLQIEAGRDLFSARTGLDEATSARFGRAAGEAYSQAWGESVEANMETARTALQTGLIDSKATDAEIESVIASLSGLTEIMGEDIPMVARAAGVMIRTGIAKNSEQAFDILTAGFQNGANASEDMLDTFTEYPALFAKLGLSGDEAMGLINQGLEAGARNSDLAADALKEFQIRATDGSKLSAEGFKAIGLNAAEMTAQIAKGGPEAKAGLDQVLDGLRAMEDPVKRNAAGVALFGTQWEDLGDSILALDVTTAVQSLGSLEGSAGAAQRALTTMSDNTSSKIVSAQRNIEIAMDGIKGALAEAFGDEIDGASEWVSKNRAPLMQFFLDVISGAFDAAEAMANFGASTLDTVAGIAEGLAELPGWLVGDELKDSMERVAESARAGAQALRTDVPAALDEVRGRVDSWAAPELMKARIHDASVAMASDMDTFSAKVAASGGTVTINGDKLTAEQALAELTANIDGTDGTVTINGDKVPASEALGAVLRAIGSSGESVTVGADTSSANDKRLALLATVARSVGSIGVTASTGDASRAIDDAARDRFSTITVGYRFTGTRPSQGMGGAFHGGLLPGKQAGGMVPGPRAGRDNILWPLVTGGQTLMQPLEGREFVVNSRDTANNLDVLKFINAGGRLGGQPSTPSAVLATLTQEQMVEFAHIVGGYLYDSNVDSKNGSARNLAARRKAPL